ncbi:MAG: glycosyltransferase family 9 protein [Deltaproteobacteria bacterium]|nr:glycosyltransferase family 9 protein [Deltaproteobacteria bacterium]
MNPNWRKWLGKILAPIYRLMMFGSLKDQPLSDVPDQFSRILVVRNDNIGDAVCTIPALEALKLRFPQAYLAVLVCRLAEDVVTGLPWIDKVYVYDKAKHGRYKSRLVAWWKQWQVIRDIQRDRFDLALGIRSTFSASLAWLVFASRAGVRVGVRPPANKAQFDFFYNLPVDPIEDPIHEVERALLIVKKVGAGEGPKRLSFFVPPPDIAAAEQFLLKHFGQNRTGPLVGVSLSGRVEDDRWWDTEKFLRLAGLLERDLGARVVYTYGPGEKEVVKELNRLSDQPPILFTSASLKGFAALVSLTDLFISLEGGPMHVAAALGVPVLGIFGRTNTAIWAPWGEKTSLVRDEIHVNRVTVDEAANAAKIMVANWYHFSENLS